MTRRLLFAAFLAAAFTAFLPRLAAQEGIGSVSSVPVRPSFAAWSRGQEAERAGKFQEALDAYAEALRDEPRNREYAAALERVRFFLSSSYANQAERAMLADHPLQAAVQLRRALLFDPQNQTARERLRQLERHTVQEETSSIPQFAAAAPVLAPAPGIRDFDIRGSARAAWLEVARQFGMFATFDEDSTQAQIRFRVAGVDFRTAALVLGEQTGTFLRPLDSHSFLVVNDTPQKRREYMPQIERTLLLPEADKPERMTELVRTVREITGVVHTQLDTATRTLTLRGTEQDVALAAALIRQLEQPRGEVMLEIDILELDRNNAENLGIVPPSSARMVTLSQQQLQLAQQSTDGLVQVIEELFGTPAAFAGSSTEQISSLLGTGATSLSSLVPPLVAFGGGQTVFLATLPGATANFASQLSAVHSAQRVLLRAEDDEPASFFVGQRYPINFATLSNEFTTQGATPGIAEATLGTDASPRGVTTAVLRTSSSFLDFITANHDAGTVSVFLGNGDGSFQSPQSFAAGTNPVAVAAATFRSSSTAVDLAVVDQGANSVQILLGNGDGTFQNPVGYPVGAAPSGLVVGDFNSDGHLDIAVTNTNDDSISILLGNGDGTFQPAATVPLATGEGPVGIISANFGGPPAAATSSSSCAALQTITNISRTAGIVTATLSSPLTVPGGNGVGLVTVAGVMDSSFDGTFTVTSGSGSTTLTWAQPGADAASSAGSATVGSAVSITSIARSGGVVTATLSTALTVPGGNGSGTLTVSGVADASFDGVFTVTSGSGTRTLTWAEASQPDASSTGGAVDAGAVQSITAISRVSATGTVTATLTAPLSVPGGNGVGRVNVAGVPDSSFDGTFVVTAGSGSTVLTWMQSGADAASAGGSAGTGSPVGTLDLAVADSVSNTATLLFRYDNGNFCSQTDVPTGTFPVAVTTGDFNADGLADFAVANENSGNVTVFLNSGTAPDTSNPGAALFTTSTSIPVGNQPDALVAGDFNSDTFQDLVVANSGDGTLTALFGAGDGTFPANITLQTSAAIGCSNLPAPSVPCQGIASGDFNGDSLQDLVVSDPANNTATVVVNSQQLAAANQQLPYPGFQYEDLGIKAKATPHIHPSGDVTLTLNLEIRSLAAASFNGIPVLTNRTVEQTVRLRPGEPSVLSGIFSDQQLLTVTGTPGAGQVPGLEQLLTNRNPTLQQTELVIMVTPRLIRLAPRIRQVLYAGHQRESGAAGRGEFEQPEGTEPRPFRPVPQPGPLRPPGEQPPGEQPPGAPRP
ncbi:MAG TPA: FG-GAP-like repeat-containing protein [Candidatus Acidoferrales bacterium]|nr:FG-GAP-like repeat-containing protein [Candidatus Acidoferrales bacterium]